jgi:uncharacterized protein
MPSNSEIVAAAFEKMAEGDPSLYLDIIHDDFRYEFVGASTWGGTYNGKADFRQNFGRILMERVTPPLRLKTQRILESGDHVILEVAGANTTRDGRDYNNRLCMIMRMAGGKIIEITEYCDTALVLDRLGERI